MSEDSVSVIIASNRAGAFLREAVDRFGARRCRWGKSFW